MEYRTIVTSNISNEEIEIKIVKNERSEKGNPLVIILTGDTPRGMNGPSSVNFMKLLDNIGISSLVFDFKGLGNSKYEKRFLNISSGIDYFKSVFEMVENIEWVDKGKIGIFATSFGANVAICCPEILNMCKCVALRSPQVFSPEGYINDIGYDEFLKWRHTGFSEKNGYDYEVMKELLMYNGYADAKRIKRPCYIVHGDNDEIIPIWQSMLLYDILDCQKEMKIIHGANHSYSNDGKWEEMANYVVQWSTKLLN